MPSRALNAWNMRSCNRHVEERILYSQHEKHIRALEGTRGMVDHTTPKEVGHLRHKLKSKKLQEDRAAEIQLENRILLQKMLSIDTKPSPLSSDVLSNQRVQVKSLHGEAHRRELDRITTDNQAFLCRLQGAKPSVDPRSWETEEQDRQALKFRLSQNSCRARCPKLRMPERPMPEKLPKIGGPGGAQSADAWAALTNRELDAQLRQLENTPAIEGRA
mmetsp:Transcript_58850/g.127302  ORF Transcript_58850/g.127302 Transcript_58850/m.127302 type:complete len:218 (-) Transcript_58850:292-945(-)